MNDAIQRADGRDEWATPPEVYERICQIMRVYPTIDLFASKENTKCEKFIDKEQDALFMDWVGYAQWHDVAPVGWLQPPYSQPLMTRAIEKAIAEAEKGFTSLFLLPNWTDQKWYHQLIKQFKHEFWEGRIKHIPPAGVKPSSPRHGSMFGVIKPIMIHTSEIGYWHHSTTPEETAEIRKLLHMTGPTSLNGVEEVRGSTPLHSIGWGDV